MKFQFEFPLETIIKGFSINNFQSCTYNNFLEIDKIPVGLAIKKMKKLEGQSPSSSKR
tara:strand:- start:65 stop:238 length:174 start_codon:yes stop_codon:yes gene_type:complete